MSQRVNLPRRGSYGIEAPYAPAGIAAMIVAVVGAGGGMRRSGSLWLWVSMIASLLAVGVPYWQIPYNKLNLPNALIGPGLLVIGISALLLRMAGLASLRRATFMVGAMAAAAVMARVVTDAARDPTSHNLWPFELVIALVVGFACAAAGAIVGVAAARLLPGLGGGDRS